MSDMTPSMAVDKPVRQITDGDDLGERNSEILRGETSPEAWNQEKTSEAEAAGQVESSSEDAGMSWGKGGETETSRERNAPTIPPGAMASLGIDPQNATATGPMPSGFGQPTQPDSAHGAQGNWNAASIYENTRIG